MVVKPILFNTEMVRALLDGRKTCTRRVVKPQHLRVLNSPYHKEHPETPDRVLIEKLCEPPYRPGDILYVRETWAKDTDGEYVYRTNYGTTEDDSFPPSMFKENYGEPCCVDTVDEDGSNLYGGECGMLDESRGAFSDLWDSTIKPADLDRYGWAANPLVWVIEFERISREEAIENG